MFIQQQLFRIISFFYDKRTINYMQNNLPVICHHMHCFFGKNSPMLDILKVSFQQLRMTVTI